MSAALQVRRRSARRLAGVGLLLALAHGAPLGAQSPVASPFRSPTCPVPDAVRGYPLTVRAAGDAALDSAYVAGVARAMANRWETPSRARSRFPGARRAAGRLVTPEPLWADDWAPEARHVARIAGTLHRDGRVTRFEILEASGDRGFDRTLGSIFAPGGRGPRLPELPETLGADSVRLVVALGRVPESDGAATVRFAAQQSPVRVVPGTLHVVPPRSTAASSAPPSEITVKYDVDPEGRMVPGSFRVLRGSDRRLARAIATALPQASFVPAHANCRPIARSVVQTFGGR